MGKGKMENWKGGKGRGKNGKTERGKGRRERGWNPYGRWSCGVMILRMAVQKVMTFCIIRC